jgi:glutamate synthase (NADPH/NADH) large chain
VGKGLSGATIALRPPSSAPFVANVNTIIGNTVLYGATAGRLFAAGQAGERFAVRNSGATAVVEGCGSNGCEYMTGGTIAILGPVGDNFAAGMTGGVAFVYDFDGMFKQHLNADSVDFAAVHDEHYHQLLKMLVRQHYQETESALALALLSDWQNQIGRFRIVRARHALSPAPRTSARVDNSKLHYSNAL